MTKHIYTDSETDALIERLRKEEPNFNLAGFLKDSLLLRTQKGKTLNQDLIFKHLNEAKANLEQNKIAVEYWEKKDKDYLVQKELNKKEEELLEEEDEIKKEKIIYKERNVKQTFQEEMGREMTPFEFDEYTKAGKAIWSFCDMLKEKEEDDDKTKADD